MFTAKIIGMAVGALLVILCGAFAYLDNLDAEYRAEQKAGSEQMREMAKRPAYLNTSPEKWGR